MENKLYKTFIDFAKSNLYSDNLEIIEDVELILLLLSIKNVPNYWDELLQEIISSPNNPVVNEILNGSKLFPYLCKTRAKKLRLHPKLRSTNQLFVYDNGFLELYKSILQDFNT